MKGPTLFLAVGLAVIGLAPAPAVADSRPATRLEATTVRKIFRLVTGQPELKDDEIGVSADPDRIWTCVWTREDDTEVVVLQIREPDGAYRTPAITDLSSLKFGMRLDLKDRIAAVVRDAARKEKTAPATPAR